MNGRAAVAGRLLALAGLALTPFLIHFSIVTGKWAPLIVAIPVLQVLILGWSWLTRPPLWRKALIAAAVAAVLSLLWVHPAWLNFARLSGVPHAIAYASLLFVFAFSLRPGREAILTRIAKQIHGSLPRYMTVYTRQVTVLWCCFFAAQLVISLLLFLWASVEAWSFFINVMNLPLVLILFAGEYGHRVWRFRDYSHDKVSDIMQLLAGDARDASRQADSA